MKMKKKLKFNYVVRKTEHYYIEVDATSEEEAALEASYANLSDWNYCDEKVEVEQLPMQSLGDGPYVVKYCYTCKAPFNYLKRYEHRAVNCPVHRNVNQWTMKR